MCFLASGLGAPAPGHGCTPHLQTSARVRAPGQCCETALIRGVSRLVLPGRAPGGIRNILTTPGGRHIKPPGGPGEVQVQICSTDSVLPGQDPETGALFWTNPGETKGISPGFPVAKRKLEQVWSHLVLV